MGVRGLTTYINYNQNSFLQNHNLHDTNLIIDGHSLCAQLYRSQNGFSAFGGDYDKFAISVKNFFKKLRKCGITSYVIFDGSYERRKLKTVYSRIRSKIHGASKLDPVTQSSLQIFPILHRDVFKQVLTEIGVSYTICEFEADDEIASMARHLNCPVLSYDSDFFIYNVLYVPFNTLDTTPTVIEGNGKTIHVLECKLYRVQYMVARSGGLKEEMLPLLATLLGNDYVEKRVFNKFFSQLKLPKSKTKNDQQRNIHALFKWLQNETLDSAISKILGRLKKNQKDKVARIIKRSIEGYNKIECRSLKFFNIPESESNKQAANVQYDTPDAIDNNDEDNLGEDQILNEDNNSSDSDAKSSDDETTDCDDDLVLGLPEWFADGIRNKTIPYAFINLFTNHLHLCSPQAEDYSKDDALLCVLPIIRYAFDILTDYTQESFLYISREGTNNYKKMHVERDMAIPSFTETPYWELDNEQQKSYFKHFITETLQDLDLSAIALLPSSFQLYMISMIWWIKNCDVPINHVHSLFITYIMLEVIDEKTGTFRGHFYFNNKYGNKIAELKKKQVEQISISEDELFMNKNKVQYEDCLIAAAVLLQHFEIDNSIKKKPKSYDVKKTHSFAQFQGCLQVVNCLNILCGSPFESTNYCKYNGTFAYNIALKLESQLDPIAFINQYLKGASSVLMFYNSLCVVYKNIVEKMGLVTSEAIGKKRRRRGKKIGQDIAEINFIVKGFESEVVI